MGEGSTQVVLHALMKPQFNVIPFVICAWQAGWNEIYSSVKNTRELEMGPIFDIWYNDMVNISLIGGCGLFLNQPFQSKLWNILCILHEWGSL